MSSEMCWKFHFITRRKSVKKCHFITSATRPSPLVSSSMQLQFWRQRTETSLTSHFVGQPESRLCDVTFCPPIKSLTWCLPALAEWKIATAVKIHCNSSDVSESRACQPGWEPTSLSQCLRSTPRTAMQSSSALAAAPCRAGASARR